MKRSFTLIVIALVICIPVTYIMNRYAQPSELSITIPWNTVGGLLLVTVICVLLAMLAVRINPVWLRPRPDMIPDYSVKQFIGFALFVLVVICAAYVFGRVALFAKQTYDAGIHVSIPLERGTILYPVPGAVITGESTQPLDLLSEEQTISSRPSETMPLDWKDQCGSERYEILPTEFTTAGPFTPSQLAPCSRIYIENGEVSLTNKRLILAGMMMRWVIYIMASIVLATSISLGFYREQTD